MNDSFSSVFSGFIFAQGLAVIRGTGHALHLECEITINSMSLTGRLTAKWDNILKRYEIDNNVLYHLLPNVMHRHLNPG
jgi:hypothetical protein